MSDEEPAENSVNSPTNPNENKIKLIVIICIIVVVALAAIGVIISIIRGYKLKKENGRPYLLLKKGDIERINKSIEEDSAMKFAYQKFYVNAYGILKKNGTLTYINKGNDLLDISREAIHRIFYTAFAYKLTKNASFLNRAEAELNAVCSFDDWNPTHFLDTAEMSFAVAIGYDWLYDDLSSKTKKLCVDALYNKGLIPSFNNSYNKFLRITNNWNQVCNSGLLFNAIAINDTYPEIAQQVINRSIYNIQNSIEEYAPDGAYTEGYSYCDYGTTYAGLMLAQLDRTFGTDYGLSD